KLLDLSEGKWIHLRALSPIVIVLCMGVVPAVLEELFFRGLLFGALRQATSARTAVIASAACFGLFHLVRQLIPVESGLNGFLLGLLLGWLAWKTGSVVPGLLLHAVHNGTLLLLGYYQPELTARGWLPEGLESVPVMWLAAGAGGAVVAFLWVLLVCRAD